MIKLDGGVSFSTVASVGRGEEGAGGCHQVRNGACVLWFLECSGGKRNRELQGFTDLANKENLLHRAFLQTHPWVLRVESGLSC